MADPKTKTPDSHVGLLKWNPATNKWLFWDGAITVSGAVDTELPAAAALADNTANPTVPAVAAFIMGFDGTTWDRLKAMSVAADTVASISSGVLPTGAHGFVYNGATWDRARGTKEQGTYAASAPLAIRLDDGATYLYVGKAAIGTATSAASWQICRITQADTTVVWADGDASFNNVWDDRASLSYS